MFRRRSRLSFKIFQYVNIESVNRRGGGFLAVISYTNIILNLTAGGGGGGLVPGKKEATMLQP